MFFEKVECLASTYKSGGLSDKLLLADIGEKKITFLERAKLI